MSAAATSAWTRAAGGAAEVVLVGNVAPPEGGVARHLRDLDALLARAGVPCRIVDVQWRPPPSSLRRGLDRSLARWWHRLRLIRELLGAAGPARALVHVHVPGHNWQSWMVVTLVALGARRRTSPLLLTLHSGLVPGYLGAGQPLGPLRRLWVGCLAPCFARVICVSPAIASALRASGLEPHRLMVLPAFSLASLAGHPVPQPADGASGELQVGAMLGPGREYGADVFFEAMGRLIGRGTRFARLRLLVMGLGTDGPAVRRLAERAGVVARTRFLGDVEHPTALAVLGGLDVFVRPSRTDGDSVSVREALALGRPTVASDASARPPGVVLFPSGDAVALASAVEQLLHGEARPAPCPVLPSEDPLEQLEGLYCQLIPPAAHPCTSTPWRAQRGGARAPRSA
jgi:glycosyltransferase involved in cell wall biosynthesis